MEKLKVNFLKARLGLIGTSVIITLIIYFLAGSKAWPLEVKDYIIFVVMFLITLIFFIMIPRTFDYEYNNSEFHVTKFGKTTVYNFNNVLYIDDYYTEKHKALTFYLKTGKLVFIALDKENKILEVFQKHCKKTVSREQFQGMFPNIKL